MKTEQQIWNTLLALLLVVVLAGCGGGNEVGAENMISGTNSKTWKAEKELSASGEKQEMTDAEEEETMQFYADGRFAMGGGGTLQTGTWAFDKAAQRLTLQFEDAEMTENFEVTRLTEDEMRLKTPDGAEMRLEAVE